MALNSAARCRTVRRPQLVRRRRETAMRYATGFVVFAVGIVWFSVRAAAAPQRKQLYEYDSCGGNGRICRRLENYPLAAQAIQRGERPETCGFEGLQPIVCCSGSVAPTTPGVTRKPEDSKPLSESISQKNCADYSSTLCFKSKVPGRTLVKGGKSAKVKEYPFMALIGYGDVPDQISWQCGGSLISEDFVLSAAHCTFPGPEIGLAKYVRMGDLNTATDTDDAEPQQFEIIDRINHPDYEPPLLYNDIALYRLNRRAKFNSYVKPICLYQSDSVPEGAGVVTGWGRIEVAGPVSKNLQKANVTFFDAGQCKQLLSSTRQIPRGIDQRIMMCAGELDGSRDTCQGDSGGPLSVQEELQITCLATQIGITSFGKQCGLSNSPGVYTKVANYLPWIESIVWPGPGPF